MLIVITHPEHLPGEALIWQQLLSAGADAILLRKPGWEEDDYEQALEQTDPACYPQLLIAGHWRLQARYGLMGVHFSESLRNGTTPQLLEVQRRQGCLLSTGIHTASVLPAMAMQWDLLLLSPVFDSISKPGYKGQVSTGFHLQQDTRSGAARVLALGGVDQSNAGLAKTMGFDGIALLGAIWKDPDKAVATFCEIRNSWNANAHT